MYIFKIYGWFGLGLAGLEFYDPDPNPNPTRPAIKKNKKIKKIVTQPNPPSLKNQLNPTG